MTNMLTAGRRALIDRLSTISVAAGYSTQAGANVRSGWFNEILQDKNLTFPLIVVQKARSQQPKPGPKAVMVFPGYSIVGAVNAGLDGYEDAIEALEQDLIRCLLTREGVAPDWLPRGITNIAFGPPETFPPAEGVKAATILLPVHLHTIIQVR